MFFALFVCLIFLFPQLFFCFFGFHGFLVELVCVSLGLAAFVFVLYFFFCFIGGCSSERDVRG